MTVRNGRILSRAEAARERRSKTRREFLESLPFVKHLPERNRCDAWKAGHGPGSVDPRKCQITAHWRFTARKGSQRAESGTYCMHHLMSLLYSDPHERERTLKYVDAFLQHTDPEPLSEGEALGKVGTDE